MSDDIVKQEIVQTYAEPYSVKIERGQKGTYGWEIKSRNTTMQRTLADVLNADKVLRDYYNNGDMEKLDRLIKENESQITK